MSNYTCPVPQEGPYSCADIKANPDISGIGVRVAIYAQTLISMLIASRLPDNEKAFRETSRNCYIVSGSLIIASLISWKKNELSLFDGLIVSMLTTIMTAFVSVNGLYTRTLGLSINIASLLFTAFWCYWGLQIWSDPWTFGIPDDLPTCTVNQDTTFVVFGHSVSATSKGLRGFAIFVFAVGSISAIYALVTSLWWIFAYLKNGPGTAKSNAAYTLAKKLQREKRRTRSHNRVQHITQYGGMFSMIYMIVTTEQMVARNPSTTEDLKEWSFGQTIVLIMLAQQIMDCFSYAKESILAKHERMKAKKGFGQP